MEMGIMTIFDQFRNRARYQRSKGFAEALELFFKERKMQILFYIAIL